MSLKRRDFIKAMASTAGTGLVLSPVQAESFVNVLMMKKKSTSFTNVGGTITAGQYASAKQSSPSAVLIGNFSSLVSVGQTVVVACFIKKGAVSSALNTVTGLGATWVKVSALATSPSLRVEIWAGTCVSSGTSISINANDTTSYLGFAAHSFSGLTTNVSTGTGTLGSSASTISTDPVSPTQAPSLIFVGALATSWQIISSGPTGSFTNPLPGSIPVQIGSAATSSTQASGLIAFKIVTGAGSYSTTWNVNTSGSYCAISLPFLTT